MKRLIIIILVCAIGLLVSGVVTCSASAAVKLPYAKGESFVVVQGYNSLPTHIKKDSYALDFSQNGCQAYGQKAVAADAGKVMFMSQEGYNGGYGTELIIDHGNNRVSRYAHLIPNSILVTPNGIIEQGQTIGYIGNTGLVAGAACPAHPGTHLHFAMDTVNPDKTFSAYNPEPISGYTHIIEGKWYLSDNAEGNVLGAFEEASDTAQTTTIPTVASISDILPVTTTIVVASTTPTTSACSAGPSVIGYPGKVLNGGVSVVAGGNPIDTQAAVSTTQTTSASPTTTVEINNSSTSPPNVFSSATATTTNSAASTSSILFQQSDDGANSPGSWYDDNWFDLGNGFAGTLTALTLEGKINDVNYFNSHIYLQEFKDANYAAMIQQFTISDDAPFTSILASTTFGGLSISLKPYFYYRLSTIQDYQNRSVILAGTTSTTTGTVMWDNFVYGTGRVQSTSTFFPFMLMNGVQPTSTVVPPSLTTPTNLAVSFDELGMQINLSWGTSTDPDWSLNPLHYDINYSTSTTLNDSGWGASLPIPVVFKNSYLIGIRAADGYGAISALATTTWNFPEGFIPYVLSPNLSYATQYFTVSSTAPLQSIQLFTANLRTGARYPEYSGCTLTLLDNDAPDSNLLVPNDSGNGGYGCAGSPIFPFASSSIILQAGHQYQWIYQGLTGNPSTSAGVQFYGTENDTAHGAFSDPSLVNARFIINSSSGVLFAN